MDEIKNMNRLDKIIDEASRLPVEKQECILAMIKGMLYVRNSLADQEKSHKPPADRSS